MSSKKRKPMVKAEDFYSLAHVEDPQIHPGGELIAFVKVVPEYMGKKYIRQLWLRETSKKSLRPITSGNSDGDYMPRWSPDGKKLAFISARGGKPQVFVMPDQWGEAVPLTQAKNGVVMFEWSPDSASIAFSARTREDERIDEDKRKRPKKTDPHTAKKQKEDHEYAEQMRIDPRVYARTVIKQGTIFKDDRNTHIYIQKLNESQACRLTEGEVDYSSFSWGIDGKNLFASTSSRASDPDVDVRSDIVRIDVKTREISFLTDSEDGDFYPRISPDGQWLYYMSFQNTDRHKQIMKIFRLRMDSGKKEDILPDYSLDPGLFKFSKDDKWLYFIVSFEGRDSIVRVSEDGGVPEFVLRKDGMVTGFDLGENGIAYTFESPDSPGDLYFLKNLSPEKEKRLTQINKKFFNKHSISKPHEIWLDRPDGTRVQGWYMLPEGYKKGKRYPWIIQVHGGPHIMWGYSWWHEFQSMCARGYGVYFSNPRGSEGYGHEFKGAIQFKWGEEDSQDILAGADKMVELGLADPSNLFLTGGSFGGFMTGWIVTHDHRFNAVVAQRGVYNFVSMYGASDALTLIEWEFDTLPWQNTELLWDRSPLKYVANVQTPVMIIHSELDFRVGISQAEEFFTALKRSGKEAVFVRYPREGHELSRSGEPRHRVDRIEKIIEWFDKHTK